MQKRLVKVGNSLALVIDKGLLSVLNINQTSRLQVGYDGGRLVIEPLIGNGDPRPPTMREALAVFRQLQRLGLTQEVFDQLAPVEMRMGTYLNALDTRQQPTHEVTITMQRMAELRKRLQRGWTKREAIAAAVAAVPFLLPTGIETRLDDGERPPQRPLLDVLLADELEQQRVPEDVYDESEDEEPSTEPLAVDLADEV